MGPADTKGELHPTKDHITEILREAGPLKVYAPIPEIRAERPRIFHPVPLPVGPLRGLSDGSSLPVDEKKEANSCHWNAHLIPPSLVSAAPRESARESIERAPPFLPPPSLPPPTSSSTPLLPPYRTSLPLKSRTRTAWRGSPVPVAPTNSVPTEVPSRFPNLV